LIRKRKKGEELVIKKREMKTPVAGLKIQSPQGQYSEDGEKSRESLCLEKREMIFLGYGVKKGGARRSRP